MFWGIFCSSAIARNTKQQSSDQTIFSLMPFFADLQEDAYVSCPTYINTYMIQATMVSFDVSTDYVVTFFSLFLFFIEFLLHLADTDLGITEIFDNDRFRCHLHNINYTKNIQIEGNCMLCESRSKRMSIQL